MDDLRAFAKDSVLPFLRRRLFGRASFGKFVVILIVGISLTVGYNLLIRFLITEGILPVSQTADAMYELPRTELIIKSLILAPIFEELIFRGLLYMAIQYFVGFRAAALISAISFGVYHMNITQGIYAFLFSFALVGMVRVYFDLLSPILLHFVANAASIFLTFNGILDNLMRLEQRTLLIIMISCIVGGNLLIFLIIMSRYRYLFDSSFTR